MASDIPGLMRRPRPETGGGRGMPALRLLPVLIVAALCMLGFRIEIVVETIANARRASLQVAPATALAQAQPSGGAQAAPGQASGAAAPAAPAAGDKMTPATPAGDAPKAEGEADAGPPAGTTFNPSSLTKSEIETLQRLSERREQIDKREQELATREAVLKAGEARIDGKVAQLQELEKNIQNLLQKYDKQKQAEIDQLVKIYGAMKPKDAAGIFDSLDMPILVSVVQTMPTAKVAPIMALMNREKARLLTEELSQKKQVGAVGG